MTTVKKKTESSPNSRASCRRCNKVIKAGTTRIGKREFSARFKKFIYRYYHADCFRRSQTTPVRGAAAAGGTKASRTEKKPAAKNKREEVKAAVVTPKKRDCPVDDKYEISPNRLAKCTKCAKLILKGKRRFGKAEWSDRYNKYIHRYYHERCFSASKRASLVLKGGSPAEELKRQQREQSKRAMIIQRRHGLREKLRSLRGAFASRLNCQNQLFRVFSDAVLDELVFKMPTTKEALLEVSGIGPKKYQSFGGPILEVTSFYRNQQQRKTRKTTCATATTAQRASSAAKSPSAKSKSAAKAKPAAKGGPARASASAAVIVIDDSDDDHAHDHAAACDESEEVAVIGKSLSCEEIVQRKFQHAANNGYVIALDD